MKISPLPADSARALAFAPAALLLASLATLTPSLAAAQTTLVEREFPTPFPLGADAAPIEDLDGDNIADILVWSRGTQPFVSTPSPPFVRTVSGLTLETLQSFPVPASWTNPMGATPIADRAGDGLPDIAVHSGSLTSGSGEVRFYSTGTGVSLGVLSSGATNGSFGADVLLLGDVNGDGVGDLAVSEPERVGSFRSGAVYVVSGANFFALYTVLPPQISQWDFGRFVLPLGDLDGDGVQDFSASFGTTQGGAPPSGFYAVSGASGDLLWSALGGQSVGASIALLDDMDGDGTPDVATARDGICPTVAGSARISIRSGATGTLISSLIDPAGSLGCDDLSVAPTSDLDGDGLADLGVGIRHVLPLAGVTSRVAFISSATGAVLGSIDGDVNSGYGLSVAMTADLNEDGVSELIVGGSVSLTPSATYPG